MTLGRADGRCTGAVPQASAPQSGRVCIRILTHSPTVPHTNPPHLMHGEPGILLYVPAGQSWHVERSAVGSVPGAHSWHVVAPGRLAVPLGQALHSVAPSSSVWVPAAHCWDTALAPPWHVLPVGQGSQAVYLKTGTNGLLVFCSGKWEGERGGWELVCQGLG